MDMRIRQTERDRYSTRVKSVTDIVLSADTLDALYALYFRDYANRYKYCNDINFSILDSDLNSGYTKWISDVKNYANNGGDMW